MVKRAANDGIEESQVKACWEQRFRTANNCVRHEQLDRKVFSRDR